MAIDDLRLWQQFLTVADAGNLSRAAMELGIAQPALSRRIAELEASLGCKLLQRHSRGVVPTPAGRLFRERAERIIAAARELRSTMSAGADKPSGRLAFGMPPSLGSTVTAPAIQRFLQAYPEVTLQVVEDTSRALRDALLSRRIEFAAISSIEPGRGLRRQPLLTEDMYLIGPPDAEATSASVIAATRLSALPLILTVRPNALRVLVESKLRASGVRPQVVIETNTRLVIELVRRGLGYTVLTRSALTGEFSGTGVSAARIRGFQMSWVLASVREHPVSQAGSKLQSLLIASASGD
jgi:LysR family transcriptional regulator, nitrogen assimilation regulatory protein